MNEFLTCNVMQSLHTCLTTKGGGFAHGDLEPLVNELDLSREGFAHGDLEPLVNEF